MFNIDFPVFNPQKLAVKLKPSLEKKLLQSPHPWIYSDSIDKINKRGNPGDIAILFRNKTNKVMGVGLYDPLSPISIKMLHYYSGITINKDFFSNIVKRALLVRRPLLQTDTNSYRLIFGENDDLPGLIADVYNNVLVVKLYSEIWFPYLKTILKSIVEMIDCSTIVLRLSRNLQGVGNNVFYDGQVLYGKLGSEEVVFKEHGVLFSANVIKGHKTGYFLDHRENRRKVGLISKGKTMLDVFAYAGGFSVHALYAGAKEVTSVDISKQALELAAQNAKLNSFSGRHNTLAGDAFEILEYMHKNKSIFDIVVIDPPSFAKAEAEIDLAIKKYRQLASLGAALVSKGGVLVLASCSSRVTSEQFFAAIQDVLNIERNTFTLFEKTYHDIDHPINFKEGHI